MKAREMTLAGWGRVLHAAGGVVRPERTVELKDAIAMAGATGLCVHGNGRSYGDSAINSGGLTSLSNRLDRILGFDDSGTVEVEPGVTLGRLMEVFLPRGWVLPVSPGTSFATVGGSVAHDVHGKNHEHAGTFGQHVAFLDLLTPDGTIHRVLPGTELFAATCGGAGMTGIITRVALRLHSVGGSYLRVTERRIRNLDDFLAEFEASATASYSVGWIDGMTTGPALGRGILETAEETDEVPSRQDVRKLRRVPFDFPEVALNPLSVRLFNAAYYRRTPPGGRQSLKTYQSFLYPLDAIHDWNRIYGRAGFHQFQCVVPLDNGRAALIALLETIATAKRASFLAVLKRMGNGRAGYLSFPMRGYTLALDFPNRPGIRELHDRLVGITLQHGGRIYLAKDALLSAAAFRAMYPEQDKFRAVLQSVDPRHVMQSDMARRLGLTS